MMFLQRQGYIPLLYRNKIHFALFDSKSRCLTSLTSTLPSHDTTKKGSSKNCATTRWAKCHLSTLESSSNDDPALKAIIDERDKLREEARKITMSFYRTCIRCIRSVRQGNERDERQFQKREEDRLSGARNNSLAFEPPVERENELNSRADYYMDYAQEEIFQESDCLDDEFWTEHTYERYLYYIKKGEYRRTWLLKDYDFPDPYPNSFNNERLDDFERRAKELVKQTYKYKGWEPRDDE